MTEDSQKTLLPVWAIVLDVFGTLLVAAGIYTVVAGKLPFAEGVEPGYTGFAFIIVGALLMAPLLVVLLMRTVGRK